MRGKHDYCLIKSKKNEKLFVLARVAELLMAETNQKEINKLKISIESEFKIDNSGDLERFLGMRILKTITLEQQKKHSTHFTTVQCARLQTKAKQKQKQPKTWTSSRKFSKGRFTRVLMSSSFICFYPAKQIRPEIMWITNVLSRFMIDTTVEQFNAGKCLLRYLKHTKSLRPLNQQQHSSWPNICRLKWRLEW